MSYVTIGDGEEVEVEEKTELCITTAVRVVGKGVGYVLRWLVDWLLLISLYCILSGAIVWIFMKKNAEERKFHSLMRLSMLMCHLARVNGG